MIENDKYNEILDQGLILDHYFLLCNMKNGVKLVDNKRIQGFINLLTKKEYIQDGELTEKALDLVENCKFAEIVVVTEDKKINMATWVAEVHAACEAKLVELTGKKQVRDKINGGKAYPFLPNPTDLAKNLSKIVTLYKLKDYDKIERTIMRYIESCHQASSWFPILYYYIIKDGKSQLVTDMDSIDEKEESKQQFSIVQNKDLF